MSMNKTIKKIFYYKIKEFFTLIWRNYKLIDTFKFSFKRLKGIEYLEKLHVVSETNITALGLENRTKLLIIDAINYSLDIEDRVFYFFNLFMGGIPDEVLNNISKADNGRKSRVNLYLNSVADEYFFNRPSKLLVQQGNVNYYMGKRVCFLKK